MTIKIWRNNDLYEAAATPPHTKNLAWRSTAPMPLEQLVQQLLEAGCHQKDIGDVLYELDPRLIEVD